MSDPQEKKSLQVEYLKTMSQLATAGFGLVAALAWNEAIKSFLDRFIASGAGLRSKFIYALLVTAIAVIVTVYLGKATQKAIALKEKIEKK